MKRTGPRTEPCETPQVRGDEGELCGGIPTVQISTYTSRERQTNRHTHKQRDADKLGDIQAARGSQISINTSTEADRSADISRERETDKSADLKAETERSDKSADIQAERQKTQQTYKQRFADKSADI